MGDSKVLYLRVPGELHNCLLQRANESGLSLNMTAILVLATALNIDILSPLKRVIVSEMLADVQAESNIF